MSGFDKYRKGVRRRGCAVCGGPVAGEVGVALRERTAGNPAKHVAAHYWSFCENHALETYEATVACATTMSKR